MHVIFVTLCSRQLYSVEAIVINLNLNQKEGQVNFTVSIDPTEFWC